MRKNRVYDPEFKIEAVKLVVEEGRTIRDVERSLGITFGILKDWVRKFEATGACSVAKGPLAVGTPEAEMKRLQKDNERLRRERDILKKAVAIFSTDPNRYSRS
jgi:transposase